MYLCFAPLKFAAATTFCCCYIVAVAVAVEHTDTTDFGDQRPRDGVAFACRTAPLPRLFTVKGACNALYKNEGYVKGVE